MKSINVYILKNLIKLFSAIKIRLTSSENKILKYNIFNPLLNINELNYYILTFSNKIELLKLHKK